LDIIKEANSIINNLDMESMFKIINQDQDDHFNYHEGTLIFYERKYAEYNSKTILMGYNIYAQDPGKEKFLLGTYNSGREVMHVLAELYNTMEAGFSQYIMPEFDDRDGDNE
jgi:hypothetical protein